MPGTYGCENPDCVRGDALSDAASLRPGVYKYRKAALVLLFFGSIFIMYASWAMDHLDATLPMNNMVLESVASSAVSSDESNLLSGHEILLRVHGKVNLCADDGGSEKPDDSAFTGQPCNPSNPNQLFVYDSQTHQFRSARKKGLCLDHGGGWAGFAFVRLSNCDAKSISQRFVLETSTLLLKNLSKDGYCLDDGGGSTAGASKFTIRRCSTKSENQHFDVLSQATLAAEQQRTLEAVADGAKILLRIAGKDDLCASGPRATIASTSLFLVACDKQNKNQLFTYDVLAKRLRSAEKPGLCMDNGGAKKVLKTDTRLASCDAKSLDQSFSYDRATMLITQPNRAGLCLDDGSELWFAAPRLLLRECDVYNANQHFEFVLQTDLGTLPATTVGTATTTALGTSTGTATTTVSTTLGPTTDVPSTSIASPSTSPSVPQAAIVTPSVITQPPPETSTSVEMQSSTVSQVAIHSNDVTADIPSPVLAEKKTNAPVATTTSTPATEMRPDLLPSQYVAIQETELTPGEGQHSITSAVSEPKPADLPVVVPLVDNSFTNVKLQYLTKADFYDEIKKYFSQTSEKLNGEVAGTHLRLEEVKDRQEKMVRCIEEASARFHDPAEVTAEDLKAAIAWVDDSCMGQ
ncbi:glycoside hydrolase 3 protein [Phytophthora pseudosyringae]|uniref:Glycoside hydrolase 3 protein n=1 Tax=Phytophthora pseudosyringae TaxID=221518 RepID=A0A8T1W4J5_9STRA|nr:glycoside hydrolase 3 protein [Phytophthora pseudosyringae]